MLYYTDYQTDCIGSLLLMSDGERLSACVFEKTRDSQLAAAGELKRDDKLSLFSKMFAWLDAYFAGSPQSREAIPLAAAKTEFQARVREALLQVGFGEHTTYGDVGKTIEQKYGCRVSSRAVGQALGRNSLGIIVPCHRVIGAGGKLTGFAGGMNVKISLLEHEGICDFKKN